MLKILKSNTLATKNILKFESDRNIEKKWLENSGLKVPKIFKNYKGSDGLVIIKFNGAEGWKRIFFG